MSKCNVCHGFKTVGAYGFKCDNCQGTGKYTGENCWGCGTWMDEEEIFGGLAVCGYCYSDKLNELRSRPGDSFCPESLERRQLCIAESEMRIEHYKKTGDRRAAEVWTDVLRMLEA